MNRYKCLVYITMTILALIFMTSYVKADSNMDGGGSGGGTESGTSQNYYSSGDDGIRITIIDTATNRKAEGTVTIDYSKKNKEGITVQHFGKVNKLEYMGIAGYSNAKSLLLSSENYKINNNGKTVWFYMPEIPVIVSSSKGNSNIEEIKQYINHGTTLKDIATRVGMNYEEMINGNYKIIVEPMIYLTFEGTYIAMTAQEAALLDMMLGGTKTTGGALRAKFVSFTHKNLPLAIFLEKKDLGVNRWTGSKYNRVSNGNILRYLGIGILSFGSSTPDTNTDVDTSSFSYRPDTDVITSVSVSASGGYGATCDNPITVQFSGELITTTQVSGIVIPSGSSRLVWFKWHTPNVTVKTTSYIYVNIISGGGSTTGNILIKINPLGEKEPSNPTADDTKPYGWSNTYLPSIPSFPKTLALSGYTAPLKSTSWHTYTCTKRYVYAGSYEDKDGNIHYLYDTIYDFTTNTYTATLTASSAELRPDTNTVTSNKKFNEVKSGYGVELKVNSNISTGSSGDVTGMQSALIYFPEFLYTTYHRIGKLPGAALNSTIQFPVNLYSMKGSRIHFLPIWYPDKEYKVYVETFDAWTPAGMLCNYTTASIDVKGSMWDDWHIGIIKND